jgi:pentatricopeptide repeat protein
MYFFYFYPLGLDRPATRYPLVTRGLTASMLVAFAWIHYQPEWLSLDPRDLVFFPGNGAPWTALTAVFLHSGWLHLLGNLIYFNVFGPPLEDRLGRPLFLVVFLMLGVAGNLCHGVVSALGLLGQAGMGVMGASGALAGLLAFSLVRFHSARVRIGWWVFAPLAGQNKAGRSNLPVVMAVMLWITLQSVQALLAGETGSSVSYGAHFGGFGTGLMMALVLGQWRQGRLEARQSRARRLFRRGAFHAAVGAWTEYLQWQPGDSEALLERARCLRLVKQVEQARGDYTRALRILLGQDRWDEALEAYREMQRAGLTGTVDPDLLARLAVQQEKQADYMGALDTYRLLQEKYPDHTAGRRALVRLVHLYHGKAANPEQAAYWLSMACRKLPGGSWREYLVSEFNAKRGDRARALNAPAGRHEGALPAPRARNPQR